MAENIMSYFKTMVVVMLFYSFSVTVIAYSLQDTGAAGYVSSFSNGDSGSFEAVAGELEEGLTAQTNLPSTSVGSLVYYSGNILIDMLLNFLYAIPEMLGFLVYGLQTLFNLEGELFVIVRNFGVAVVTALYILGVVQLLAGLRTGRII